MIIEKTCSTLARTEDFCCSFFFLNSISCAPAFISRFLNRLIVSPSVPLHAMIYYKNLKMIGCLLLALLFAYLIDCTNFVANTAVALAPCHTAYSPALLCSRALLLSLSTRPTVSNSFFFVFLCASESLSSLSVICFIIPLSYLFLFCLSFHSLRSCPRLYDAFSCNIFCIKFFLSYRTLLYIYFITQLVISDIIAFILRLSLLL